MLRPRSRSPHYSHRVSPRRQDGRRFPWDDPDFNPQQVLADLGRLPGEDQWVRFMDEIHPDGPEGHRRPVSPGLHRLDHHLPPEEFHHRRIPPAPHELGYAERRRLSPHDGRGGGRGKGSGSEGLPHSPQRLPREKLPSLAPQHPHYSPDHHQIVSSAGWRREEQDQSQGRSRDRSPRERVQGGGKGERRGGDFPGPYGDRSRDDMHREKSTISDRNRREADEAVHPGYGKETEFRVRRPSLERPREEYGGGGPRGRRGPSGSHDGRGPGTLIVEHDHGIINSRGPELYDNQRGRGPDQSPSHDRFSHRHHRARATEERFRKSDSRSNTREEARGRLDHEERRGPRRGPVHEARRGPVHEERRGPVHEERRGPVHEERRGPVHEERRGPIHESRRSPDRHGRASPMGFQDRGSPTEPRARNSAFRGERGAPAQGGKRQMGPSMNQPRPLIQGMQGYRPRDAFPQHSPPEHQGYQPRGGVWDMEPREEAPGWAEVSDKEPRCEKDRGPGPRGGRPPAQGRMDPRKPQHSDLTPNWNQQQNDMGMPRMGAGEKETLTIKVDMNRPVGQNSQLCYSSDRQLSLDLVNVGRQRLDFLPMLEHSGTYQESAMHSGTFAQEIITLVHQVKEHYFRGDGVTLNERFSGPQDGGLPEEEEQEEEGPTLNRLFNMSMSEPDMEPVFSKVGRMQRQQQAVRDPGDLRHDLERRRQERLEGVKVTIPGGRLSQHPLAAGSDHQGGYGREEDEEQEGFSGWSGPPRRGRRWPADMGGQRRGGMIRQDMGDQQRNNWPPKSPCNLSGSTRQQNHNINGANW
ncbi:pre-mRNA 3' end processing protein WDR33 [Oncorhynchus mykiss]|uniref:pre-mRNA 3' end processing protein WDR33 n=1 Tax=Oncorhynchus mykiss TaxID=8022 RepID=UPI001878B2E1|nr:pre-mRNA 3' end processing protein WDR33 [Oncorhynchus mykiss]